MVWRPAALALLLALLALVITSCGGEEAATETVTVIAGQDATTDGSEEVSEEESGSSGSLPDLVGERLDVAEDALDDLGIDYEEIGGGTFGVVDASNWTVCAQDPEAGVETTSVELVVARPGECDASTQGDSDGSTDSIPKLAGVRLDVAEDQLEDLGIAYEIIGGGTFGVLDHTAWEVCSTRPRAGQSAQVVKLIVDRPGEC